MGSKPWGEQIVALLIGAYPAAACKRDEDEFLPLHYAIDRGARPVVIELLIEAFPESVDERDARLTGKPPSPRSSQTRK